LIARGFDATQSSVSRDLKELGAVKTASGYELPGGTADDDEVAGVADLLRGIETAGPNLLVIKTAIGAAQRVALALDRSGWPEMVGNVGGDDTILVATKSAAGQRNLLKKIERASA
jgi:transcriptional regulator of arginine metabolism